MTFTSRWPAENSQLYIHTLKGSWAIQALLENYFSKHSKSLLNLFLLTFHVHRMELYIALKSPKLRRKYLLISDFKEGIILISLKIFSWDFYGGNISISSFKGLIPKTIGMRIIYQLQYEIRNWIFEFLRKIPLNIFNFYFTNIWAYLIKNKDILNLGLTWVYIHNSPWVV